MRVTRPKKTSKSLALSFNNSKFSKIAQIECEIWITLSKYGYAVRLSKIYETLRLLPNLGAHPTRRCIAPLLLRTSSAMKGKSSFRNFNSLFKIKLSGMLQKIYVKIHIRNLYHR
jgi:hypothetical protein